MEKDIINIKNTQENNCIYMKEKIVINDSILLYTIDRYKESKIQKKTNFFEDGVKDDFKIK